MDTLNRILDLLTFKNKEQQHLADYLGLRKSVVTDWKSHKSHSYMKYINQISTFFEVPVDMFYCSNEDYYKYRDNLINSNTINSNQSSHIEVYDQTAIELLNAYNTLSLSDKARALAYVCSLKDGTV